MTRLEELQYQKKCLSIADTVSFSTPYENEIWKKVSQPIVVYGISRYGSSRIDKAIERVAKKYNISAEKVCEDTEIQTAWFHKTYDALIGW